jgi:hypothetical protein
MNEKPSPKRRCRRWTAGILIAALALAWWLWPRADARFVGRWEAYNSNTSVKQPVCIIELSSNGRGRTTFSDGSSPDDFFWSVEQNHFRSNVISGPVWQTIFRRFFARLWMKLTGTPDMQGVHELRIEKAAEKEIRLMSPDGDWIIYRRVAD